LLCKYHRASQGDLILEAASKWRKTMKFSSKKNTPRHHVDKLGEYACGLACLCRSPNYYGAEFSQKKLGTSVVLLQSGTPFSGWFQAAQKIGYWSQKALRRELKPFGPKGWRPCNSPCGSRIKTEEALLAFILAWPMESMERSGAWYLGMEESELTAQWKFGHSPSTFNLQKATSNKPVVHKSKKPLVCFSDYREDIPISHRGHGDWELQWLERGLSTAIFFSALWLTTSCQIQSYEKANYGSSCPRFFLLACFRAILGYIQGVF